MNRSIWQQLKPHVIAIAIFLLISVIYCFPALKGLQPAQHDIIGWKAMSQQSMEFKEKYGHYPLWTNSMLSGMPTYQIAIESKHNFTVAQLARVYTLFLPAPAAEFFAAALSFYILCMAFGLRTWVSVLGAIGYAYASYNPILFIAGHLSKLSAIAYAPGFIAGLVLLTKRKYVSGFLTTMIFATFISWANHVQILYYTFLIAGLLGIAYVVYAIRNKAYKPLLVSASLAVVATVLALASYAVMLLPLTEYAKETMRGGRSELTPVSQENKTRGGLDKDYAFNWSYGITETFTAVVPRIYGGGDPKVIDNRYVSELGEKSKTAEAIADQTGMPEEQASEFAQSPQFSPYWGPQPGTSGTVYFGAAICFLFIVGLVLYREWHLAWILAATVLGILLAWGKNFSAFNYFLFDHLPYYSKFRAPSMSLVIPQLTVPLLAAIGLNRFIVERETGNLAALMKKFVTAIYITAGMLIVLTALYFMFDYTGADDAAIRQNLSNGMLQQLSRGAQPTPEMQSRANEFGRSVIDALHEDRKSMYGNDLLRSFAFIAIAAGLLYAYARNKLAATTLVLALNVVSFIDLIVVDLRYLSHKNYEEEPTQVALSPSRADQQILQDTGYYRVLDQTGGNPFLDSRASYFHNSVGGQHPARLALYDDLINHQLTKGNMQVYNMLNTKYFIASNPSDGQPVVQQNPEALGPAWLVKTIKYVNDANEEMQALNAFTPKDTVIVDKREQSKIPFTPQYDSAAYIHLVRNLNDDILYDFNAASNQFVVFSEIYYPRGWKAFIDGKETPIARVDYVLRGLAVPAGKHQIEFRFEPAAFKTGDLISLVVGILSYLILLAGAWWEWRNYRKKTILDRGK